jgi:hypothetical protein
MKKKFLKLQTMIRLAQVDAQAEGAGVSIGES